MSVQVKGSGTIGGLDEGLNIVGVVTATSFSGAFTGDVTGTASQVTIAGGADNRIITASSANTLSGESTLTYDGTYLDIGGGVTRFTKQGSYNSLEIGYGQNGNQNAFIDLIGDTTYTDYGTRIIRYGQNGANGTTDILHRGTGSLNLQTSDAADIVLKTNGNNERIRITSGGLVGINQNTPTHMLHVDSSNASDSTATAFFKGRIIRFDGAASAHSPRLNLSLDGTDKATILLHRTNDDLEIQTLTASPIRFSPNSTERLRINSGGILTQSASGGDNQFVSQRTGATYSNGDYFFYLFAQNNGGNNVGGIGIVRDTANDNSRLMFSTAKSGTLTEALRIDQNRSMRHMGTAGYWQITVIHNGSGSGNWYSGSAPQQIYPNYIDNRTGYAEFLIEFNPSVSYSGYSSPTFVICGGDGGLKTGGTIELNTNRRTNSPSNGTFRSYHGQFSWQIYNDGDTDAVAGQREINRNVEHRSSSYIAASTQSVDYIANNDGRYGTNVEPIIDQRSYIKIKINGVGSHNAVQGHPFICRFVTYSQGDKNWFAYMQYN